MTKKAIIIGASSGMGKSLSKILVSKGYKVGITARRLDLLNKIKSSNNDNYIVKAFDITDLDNINNNLNAFVRELDGLDLLVFSAGIGLIPKEMNFDKEKKSIDTNVMAFTSICVWAYNFFKKQGSGHLVAISSVAGHKGSRGSPSYSASKAFQINYIESLWHRAYYEKINISITDIRPGFVDTAMAKGDFIFWMANADTAAKHIYKAIRKKRKVAYVTKPWQLIAIFLMLVPKFLYKKW